MADLPAFHAYALDERVARPAGFLPPRTLAETRAKIRKSAADWEKPGPRRMVFSIIRKRGRLWIGGISLRWPHGGVGEIGYGVQPDHWGQGYASEAGRRVVALAFDQLGAHRVQATCWVKNSRSTAVLAKAGLLKEGRLRGYLRRGKTVRDEFIFGMTRADWKR